MTDQKSTAVVQTEPQSTVVVQAESLLGIISKAAADPATDVDKLERLMGLYERITAKNAAQEFAHAMNEVQRELQPVIANANNPQTRSKYATYDAVDAILRPIYGRHGFSISFGTGEIERPEMVRVTAKLRHESGHTEPYHIDMPADGKGAKGGDVMTKTHATGSAMSYGKRYLLLAMFNVPVKGEDDDGNRAAQTGFITEQQKEQIVTLLRETDADVPKFLEYMAVDNVDELPAAKFQKAINLLNAKKRQAQK